MSLARRTARAMLSSIFITGGLNQLRNSRVMTGPAEPVTTPIADRIPQLPNDPEQLVRLDGAVKVAGGVLMVFGPFARPAALLLAGSLVPTTLAGHRFWEEQDPNARAQQQVHFLKNVSMLGGLLLAALDTGGRPSVPWRTRRAARHAVHRVEETTSSARDSISDASEALAGAAGAVGGALASSAGAVRGVTSRRPSRRRSAKVRGAAAETAGAIRGTAAETAGAIRGAAAHGAGVVRGAAAETAGKAAGKAKEAAGSAKHALARG